MRPFSMVDRIAEWSWLDEPAGTLRDAVLKLLRGRRVHDTLHGVWLGHPLHPSMVQVPVGAFLCASFVDALPGQGQGERRVSAALIRIGLVASLPASLAGAVDYAKAHEEQQRTGLVHAVANSAALTSYLLSVCWRATGRHQAGRAAGWAGLTLTATGALLGGHLSFHQSNGANHADSVPHVAPESWTDLGDLHELPDRAPTRRMVGEVPVLIVRDGENVYVLADRCSHASAPLHQGTVTWSQQDSPCVECPWHGSVFRLADGGVEHGPATAPQPGFHTRIVDDRVHARVRLIPGVPAGG